MSGKYHLLFSLVLFSRFHHIFSWTCGYYLLIPLLQLGYSTYQLLYLRKSTFWCLALLGVLLALDYALLYYVIFLLNGRISCNQFLLFHAVIGMLESYLLWFFYLSVLEVPVLLIDLHSLRGPTKELVIPYDSYLF